EHADDAVRPDQRNVQAVRGRERIGARPSHTAPPEYPRRDAQLLLTERVRWGGWSAHRRLEPAGVTREEDLRRRTERLLHVPRDRADQLAPAAPAGEIAAHGVQGRRTAL